MPTLPVLIADKLLPTRPLPIASLSSHERDQHRAELAATIEAMLASWYQPNLSSSALAAYLIDWTDQLEGFKPHQVRSAFAAYRDQHPDKRPNPSHVKAILNDRWGRHVIAQAKAQSLLAETPPEAPARASRERAAEIAAAAGFARSATMNPPEGAATSGKSAGDRTGAKLRRAGWE